ncbi:glycosyltransferase family 21 protein, partial [Lepidopterella palustris CBS 459.81]
MFAQTVAALCLIWYIFIVIVCSIGYLQLFRYYSKPPTPAACLSEGFPEDEIPHITIIRPVCGLEPRLYDCLAATFRQTYPRSKLTIYICIASRTDPALPLLERLLADFPAHDAKIFVEDEDKKLLNSAGDNDNGRGEGARLGPNPKIRNMSRAYREARGDVVWICDCNVWVGKGVAGRMVDVLCGFGERGGGRPYKFVHQLPLVVDTVPEGEDSPPAINSKSNSHSSSASFSDVHSDSLSTSQTPLLRPSPQQKRSIFSHILQTAGGRLEETFMASSHAKFYTAINTVAIAPCIVGKSNMFRRSHLDSLTSSNAARSPGIDFFSDNICEDHLIGDMLWKVKLPCEREGGGEGQGKKRFGTHALLFGDPALQPMSSFSIPAYIARRVRWLRVRKFTVTLATLVEPGTESFLCSAYLAFAVTTLPGFESWVGVPRTWTAFWIVWVTSVVGWACVDCMLYAML